MQTKVLDEFWTKFGARGKVNAITTHPEGDINVCTKFHSNPSNNLLRASGIYQNYEPRGFTQKNTSSGNTEFLEKNFMVEVEIGAPTPKDLRTYDPEPKQTSLPVQNQTIWPFTSWACVLNGEGNLAPPGGHQFTGRCPGSALWCLEKP